MWSAVAELIWFALGIIGVGALLQWKSRSLASSLILGQIAVYLCWLATLDVQLALPVLKVAAIFGVWVVTRSGQAKAFWISFLLLGQLFLADPVQVWDELFVWAFHGKALHSMPGPEFVRALSHPELWLVHSEYPKLYAVLAAMITQGRAWGAFWPKFPMVLLLLPSWLVIYRLPFSRARRALLVLITLTFMGRLGLTVYMDNVLSAAAMAGALALFTDPKQRREGVLLVSLMPLLKTEGLVLAVIILGVYALQQWRQRARSKLLREGLWFAPAAAAIVAWKMRCTQNGITSYYTNQSLSQETPLSRFIHRAVQPGSYWEIWSSLAEAKTALFCIAVLLGLYLALDRKKPARPFCAICLVSALYLGFLTLVYLGTPMNLTDHLVSSAERTILPIHFLIFGAFFTSELLPVEAQLRNVTSRFGKWRRR